jgi:hypothetical protein
MATAVPAATIKMAHRRRVDDRETAGACRTASTRGSGAPVVMVASWVARSAGGKYRVPGTASPIKAM